MSEIYQLSQGDGPLLISMPHSGTELPSEWHSRLTNVARRTVDTDWHIPKLYDFVDRTEVSVLQANMSRYVVDLNRAPDNQPLYPGQFGTGLCPTLSFAGEPLYSSPESEPSDEEIQARVARYWQPYHQALAAELQRIRDKHGYALLYDAHSIASRVPQLFEGELPALNLGSARGESCAASIETAVAAQLAAQSDYSQVLNGRFVGGYITRQYGRPAEGVHALQMEIAQVHYMDEQSFQWQGQRASGLQLVLQALLARLQQAGAAWYQQQ